MRNKPETKKLPKGVSQEFADGLNTMDTLELKATIVRLQVQYQENEAFKETPGYQDAKAEFDMAKDRFELVAGPIKETAVSVKNRTKMVVERLKEKGGA